MDTNKESLIHLHGKYGRGKFTRVSSHRFKYLDQFEWHLGGKSPYVTRVCRDKDSPNYGKKIPMHREIMGFPQNLMVDHKDRDTLNNTDENLRIATHAQNCYNRTPTKDSTSISKYVGVHYNKAKKKWVARISHRVDGKKKNITIGLFPTEQEAARARDGAAIHFQGEFAVRCIELDPIPYSEVKHCGTSSRFRGVCWNKRVNKWRAFLRVDKLFKGLGNYDSEEVAARVVDWFLSQLNLPLNCPDQEPIPYTKQEKTSNYAGVSYDKKRNTWIVMVWEDSKAKYMGSFTSEEAAAEHYNNYKNLKN